LQFPPLSAQSKDAEMKLQLHENARALGDQADQDIGQPERTLTRQRHNTAQHNNNSGRGREVSKPSAASLEHSLNQIELNLTNYHAPTKPDADLPTHPK
jgi:hypothetical protein